MVTYKFFLDGQLLEPNDVPNWSALQVLASFDSSSVQANITTEEFEFVNGASLIIRNHIDGGLTGLTNGIYEGLPFQIQVTNGTIGVSVFDGYLDFNSYQEISPVKVKCKIKKNDGLNSLEDRVTANSFGYLYEKGFIKDSDFVNVPYIIEKLNNEGDVALLTVTTFLIGVQIAKVVADLNEAFTKYGIDQANPATAPTALLKLIASALPNVLLGIFLVAEGGKNIIRLKELLVPKIRNHKGIRLRTLMEKASNYLGYQYESDISELDNIIYLPSKPFNDKQTKKTNSGISKGIPNVTDFGYQLSEAFELVNRIAYSKIQLDSSDLIQRPLNDAFWTSTSSFQVADVLDETVIYNNNDISGRFFISFATDDLDDWTIDNFTGTNVEIITSAVSGNDSPNNLIKGFEEASIPLALGTPKDSLNAVESALGLYLSVIESATNTILAPVRKIQRIIGLPAIPQVNIPFPEDRLEVLKVSQKIHSVAKLLYSPPNKSGKIPLDHRNHFSAKVLWDKYHNYRSFVDNNFGGQRRIFIEKEIPFGFSDFLNCIENSYFILEDGRVGKMEEIKWNLDGDKAICSYWVQETFTTNLQQTIIEG